MSLKDKVLEALSNQENFISGQELAARFGVSRNSIWKAICSLKEDGYEFESVTKRGYKLSNVGDVLTISGIEKYLNNPKDYDIHVLKEATSTNTMVKQLAENGEPQGLLFATTYQSQGRGRGERSFYSPREKGVYFSLLLQPKLSAEQSMYITIMAGVSLCRAIKEITGIDTQIKWVNDLYYKDKKIAGILSEAALSYEDNRLKYVVVGLGLNLVEPLEGYPESIRNVAGALYKDFPNIPDLKNRIVAKTCQYLINYSEGIDKSYIEEYKNLQWLPGKEVDIYRMDENCGSGVVKGLDDELRLIVKREDGTLEYLNSGEVRVKIK